MSGARTQMESEKLPLRGTRLSTNDPDCAVMRLTLARSRHLLSSSRTFGQPQLRLCHARLTMVYTRSIYLVTVRLAPRQHRFGARLYDP